MKKQNGYKLKLRFAIATLIASTAIPVGVSLTANAASQRSARTKSRVSRPRLVELTSVDQLKEVFERDSGNVRLVALVSPT